MNEVRTVLTIAQVTLREATRRRVVLATAALTVLLVGVSAWGFHRVASSASMTSGEARLTTSILLNLIMFGFSLIAALGTAFLAGPTLAGETESGIALSVLARPIRRSSFLLGKWLGLVVFGSVFVIVAALGECLVIRAIVDYWPPDPVAAFALLAAQTIVLLTLAVLLSTAISPMASGVIAVGLFGAVWIAGVVGGIGESIGNESIAKVGTAAKVLLPTDGLWRGAMHAFQHPAVLSEFGEDSAAFPFLSQGPPTVAYLLWAGLWVVMVWGLAALAFGRRDL